VKKIRVIVDFPVSVLCEINGLARRSGRSKATVLRDAIELYKYFHNLLAGGATIHVERDGKIRRVRLFS